MHFRSLKSFGRYILLSTTTCLVKVIVDNKHRIRLYKTGTITASGHCPKLSDLNIIFQINAIGWNPKLPFFVINLSTNVSNPNLSQYVRPIALYGFQC